MKTLLLSLVAGFILTASTPPSTDYVYICNGKYSKKYHLKEDCRGLNNCSTKVEKVTLKDAKDKGRTLCGFED
ncbi:hypothetical protein AM493_02560 [Flavobacterium akiainvivens]|uniref:Uncharacterized protein n=1 Tax=Flavobacterium akiainvivens TaxID=1202724 RepID=A0A0M9VH04_9FLAO|nr:hypothetical protein [Flavobacterium akiainvivens]KOS05039.1 hypothetical protein AM493_02560 [Flavobacterium akiainvivens]SFQ39851.1 hypothetical protein SAMN05444144_1046 [Flavobacterium akiainvivens]